MLRGLFGGLRGFGFRGGLGGRLLLTLGWLTLGWLTGLAARRGCLRDLHRRTRPCLDDTIDDDPVASLQAADDDPFVARPVADLYRARLDDALRIDGQHDFGARAFEDR